MNGGMLRCFNLLNQLCKHFQVTALMNQDKESFLKSVEEFPAIKNGNLISTKDKKKTRDLYSILPAKYRDSVRYRIWNRSLKGKAESNYLILYPQLNDFLKSHKVDCVILEDMSILSLARLVKRRQPSVPVIYDAYNVNSILAAKALEQGEIDQKHYDLMFLLESSLYQYVKRIFTCSTTDLEKLIAMNQGRISGEVIPNGVNIPAERKSENEGWGSADILFCGSLDYFPNQEGLTWFCRDVFPLILRQLPAARLLVVGKGDPGDVLKKLLDNPSMVNYGKVDRVEPYYRKSALAIVPLLSGSGTRLKLLEAMALKSAVVSTTPGAEGIHYTDNENILIADGAESFAQKVIDLLRNPSMAKSIAEQAFSLVIHEYDWNIVGEKMAGYLNGIN
jgi:polysaccharide biosynthesis protein PslH